MISDKFSCIFVHIPKAAGQSIEHFFLNLHNLSWDDRSPLLLKYNLDKDIGPERLAHLFASEYVDLGHIDLLRFNHYFKFTFVRNPWARLVSEYKFRDHYIKMPFRDFVLNGLPPKSSYNDAYRHIEPQYNFIYDKSGTCLVDFVGKFEKLQEGFDHVCSKINIHDSKLPHINSSNNSPTTIEKIKKLWSFKKQENHQHYTTYYDEDTLAVVNNIYAIDISTFGYVYGE
jgi:hypothetical protein